MRSTGADGFTERPELARQNGTHAVASADPLSLLNAPQSRRRSIVTALSSMSAMEVIMQSIKRRSALILSTLCLSAVSFAQPRGDAGKMEYEAHCAICHGTSGAGNGEMRRYLTKAPSDLTTIAKRNGGAFPNQLVWELIDGRSATEIGPHGAREMPVWGQRYRMEALMQASTAAEPEWYVRNRIVALLDYLARMQAK